MCAIMADMGTVLTSDELSRELRALDGWTRDGDAIVATSDAPDFMTAIRLVDAVAQVAEEANHHPDIDIRWKTVHWRLSTHSAGGVTAADIDLARHITGASRSHGATFVS